MAEQFMTYKGRPVVRNGKTIYYGSMANEYVVMMNVMAENERDGATVATAIRCYLMKTDKSLSPMDAMVQNGERNSLFGALELAAAWLSRPETAG